MPLKSTEMTKNISAEARSAPHGRLPPAQAVGGKRSIDEVFDEISLSDRVEMSTWSVTCNVPSMMPLEQAEIDRKVRACIYRA